MKVIFGFENGQGKFYVLLRLVMLSLISGILDERGDVRPS